MNPRNSNIKATGRFSRLFFKLGLSSGWILACLAGFAQTSPRTYHPNQHGWFNYFGNHRLTDKWGLHTEYQWRRHDWVDTPQQSLMRVGVDFRVNPALMLTAGYGWIVTYPYGDLPVAATFNEHRIWQQVILTQNFGRVTLGHRYRLEQRFVDRPARDAQTEEVTFTRTLLHRVRYMPMVTIPLNGPKLEKGVFYLRAWDEMFLGFGQKTNLNLLDQNRASLELGYCFSSNTNWRVGYLNQLVTKSNARDIENNHTLLVSLTHNIDWRKKTE